MDDYEWVFIFTKKRKEKEFWNKFHVIFTRTYMSPNINDMEFISELIKIVFLFYSKYEKSFTLGHLNTLWQLQNTF